MITPEIRIKKGRITIVWFPWIHPENKTRQNRVRVYIRTTWYSYNFTPSTTFTTTELEWLNKFKRLHDIFMHKTNYNQTFNATCIPKYARREYEKGNIDTL